MCGCVSTNKLLDMSVLFCLSMEGEKWRRGREVMNVGKGKRTGKRRIRGIVKKNMIQQKKKKRQKREATIVKRHVSA